MTNLRPLRNRQPSGLDDEELMTRLKAFSAHYASGRHKGHQFSAYAKLVLEYMDRAADETADMHVEYAPVFNGLVLDDLAVSEPTTLDGRLPHATRLVTPWRTP